MRLRNNPNALKEALKINYFKDLSNVKNITSKSLFKNSSDSKTFLEIGSGKGDFLWKIAWKNQTDNFLGIEKSATIVLKALNKYQKNKNILNNLLLCLADANKIDELFKPQSFNGLYLNFSDPWPKKRHAKRRLVDLNFLNKYEKILKPKSFVEFKTDDLNLFNYCIEQINLIKEKIKIIDKSNDLHSLSDSHYLKKENITSEYEEKFKLKNKKINKIIFEFI